MAFDFTLSPELKRIQGVARELASEFAERAATHDRDRSTPTENFARLRESGFFGIVVPEEYGGMGAGLLGWTVAAQELARGCASTALGFSMHVVATGLGMHSSDIPDAAKRRLAELVVGQGKLICNSVSEPSNSSYAARSIVPTVSARKVEGGYRLHGKKMFASNWEASDFAYLWAHLEGDEPGSSVALLAPTRGDGIRVHDTWDSLGMRATRSQAVELDGAFVSDDCLLHRTDSFARTFMQAGTPWTAGPYTAVYLGLGLAIIEFAKEYVTRKIPKSYAQPLAYHPDVRRRMSEMYCAMEGASLAMYKAAWSLQTIGPTPETRKSFFYAKYLVGEAVSRTAQNAAMACGASALVRPHPLERMLRDAATAPLMPPSADTCLAVLALLEMGLSPAEAVEPLKLA